MRVVAVFGLAAGVTAMQNGPVKKVVQLLKDMQTETTANQKKDEEANSKFLCWFKETETAAKGAISEAASCIDTQKSRVAKQTGAEAVAKGKSESAEEGVTKAQAQLQKATTSRTADAEAFANEEKELIKTIGALKQALTVLKKHNPSFLQQDNMKDVKEYLTGHASEKLNGNQRRVLKNFLQGPSGAVQVSQSGEIFGILDQMLIDTTEDLKQATDDETTAIDAFAHVKEMQQSMIKRQSVTLNQGRLTQGESAQEKEDGKAMLQKCKKELETNTNILESADAQNAEHNADFAARGKAQALELEAIAEAIKILDSEDAFAAFARTTDGPTLFLQKSLQKIVVATRLQNVLDQLNDSAGDQLFNNFGVGKATRAVALMIQQAQDAGGSIKGQDTEFQKILEAVGNQILAKKLLLATKEQEKDDCTRDINESDARIVGHKREKVRNESRIETLTLEIAALDKQIKEDKEEKAALEKSSQTLTEDRSQANAQYHVEMEENTAAVLLLAEAKDVMAEVFGGLVLVQKDDPSKAMADGAPAFEAAHEQHAGGKKVLAMLDTIISDVKGEMKVSTVGEEKGQKAYEQQMKTNNDAIDTLTEGIVIAVATKERKAGALFHEGKDLGLVETDLGTEEKINKAKHGECDFLMNNYSAITEAHQFELDGLISANQIIKNVIRDLGE